MSRFNKGIIFTNEQCIGCNHCLSLCSIMGANISVLSNNKQSQIHVDSDKCNHCGKCIEKCNHNARDYFDDTLAFIKDLKENKKISVIIDPTFFVIYKDKAKNILGYLKHLGVEKFYNSSIGTEISIWAHINYLKNTQYLPGSRKAFITNRCPSVTNMIELQFPNLRNKIVPVQSPLVCSAIYVKKYLNDSNSIAILSPCISVKDELTNDNNNEFLNYSVTYKKLLEQFRDINLSDYDEQLPYDMSLGIGNIILKEGNFKGVIEQFFSKNEYITSLSLINPQNFKLLQNYSLDENSNFQPLLVDFVSCPTGCLEGPGIDRKQLNFSNIYNNYFSLFKSVKLKYQEVNSYEQYEQILNDYYRELNSIDFKRTFKDRYRQPYDVPEDTIEEIFLSMHKDTEHKKNINCGLCGYATCLQMAKAIAFGFNRKESCIKYVNEEIVNLNNIDLIAKCPNKNAFVKNTLQLIEDNPSKKYIIISGDINRFKIINDLYSAQIADKVLYIIAQKLTETFVPDGNIGRISGGQFAICVEDTVENIQKIRKLKFFDCSSLGINYPITMRFGLYITEQLAEEKNIMYMINCANLAMDMNISQFENTYTFFNQELREKQYNEAKISNLMQSAIDNKEFVLYFQPQYDSKTKKMIGAEVLCRWIQKDNSIISPAIFIPVAEKNGFIRFLDIEIWKRAFKTLRGWLDKNITPVPLSLNISRVSLQTDDFIYKIKHLQDKYNIPTEYIHFEVTESAYMMDQQDMIRRIGLIRNMGFLIAMDDFGSGYSSLNTLKDIPLDIIKLDMGFIKNDNNIDKGHKIISSIINMANDLKLITVAEGVETKEQADFFTNQGCKIIQGFYYSKPVPLDEYNKLLK